MLERKDFASIIYRDLRESQKATFEVAAGYGRWLMASLLLAHGGGLVGAFGLFKEAAADAILRQRIVAAAWWLVVGLLVALASGLTIWVNWSFHSENYGHRADPEMLWNPQVWERPPIRIHAINVTYWLSLGLGVTSALCILGAAFTLLALPAA